MANPDFWHGAIPWVSPKDMKRSRLWDAIDHVTENALGNGTRLAPAHSLLLVVRGMILAHTVPVARVEAPLAFNQDIKALIPRSDVDSDFLLWWLTANESLLLGITTESTHGTKRVPMDGLHGVEINLPPLPEQRAIAAALSDVDALLEGLTRLIAKKRDLKQAAMQQLLTGQTRLPGFYGEWAVKTLGDVARIQRGASPRPIDSPVWFTDNSTIGWVRISDVTRSGMFLRDTTQKLTALGVQHSRPVRRGSLIMSICATVGRPIITDIDTCIHDGFVVFDDLQAERMFIFYVLKWIEPVWSKHGQTGSQMNLNTGLIAGTHISLPPVHEQVAIAAVLSDMDAELTALEARRDKTRALKQAMMQELLTGRTRLVLPAVTETRRESERTDGRRANIYFKRSVLAAEIIDRLHHEPTFGHVKFEKMIYLVEQLCDVDTGSEYHRDAAGPYDNRAIRSIDSQLRKQKWFDAQKSESRYRYEPMANRGKHKEYFERYFGGISAAFDTVIETFRGFTTERCEMVATLFAAWSDLLQQKGPISDDAIVNEVLNNWHESKKRIPEDRWRKALAWMRDHGFVPQKATGAV